MPGHNDTLSRDPDERAFRRYETLCDRYGRRQPVRAVVAALLFPLLAWWLFGPRHPPPPIPRSLKSDSRKTCST